MHGSSLCRMRWFVENYLQDVAAVKRKVLDVGSCEVAGGSYKQFFPSEQFEYFGLDMAQGPNVDIVPANVYHWREIDSDSYDVVISGQAFEHVEFFWLTAAEMARALKPGGLLCLIAPRGFERHRYPVDCYRFDSDGLIAIARWCNLQLLHASTDMAPEGAGTEWHIEACEDSMLIARKPENWPGILDSREYVFAQPDLSTLQKGFVPCRRLTLPVRMLADYDAQKAALAQARTELAAQKAEFKKLLSVKNTELTKLKEIIKAYENSNSWRLTRPLRAIRKVARKCLRRPGN